MFKKISALLLCFVCAFAITGCKKETTDITVEKPKEKVVAEKKVLNPLTGLSGIAADKVSTRPVAVMINNINIAQPVQAGINDADIVYETEVEGGITRLMAVFQDVTKAEKIGTVRSARYVYVDLAMGHNAIYVHHGQDPIYCAPHLKDTDDYTVGTNNSGVRVSNGLATEHTLYAYGAKMWDDLVATGHKTENTGAAPWQKFADENKAVKFEGAGNSVSIAFSTSYKTVFNYDATTGKYIRSSGTTVRKDYYTKQDQSFKNVFVLMTTISDYQDHKHRNINLTSGTGYYLVNGTYTEIKWSKGSASSPLTFTDMNGNPLEVNAGNSYVGIADSRTSTPVIA